MALTPYPKPTTPWSPNGIAHYALKADRPDIKADWEAWVTAWQTDYRTSNQLVIADCETNWTTVKIANASNGAKSIGQYTFTSAGSTFVTAGVTAGDTLKITSGTEQGDYVIQSVDSQTQLTIVLTSGWISTESSLTFTVHNEHSVKCAIKKGSNKTEENHSVAICARSTFTTGLVAYFPTGTLNLSSYQRIRLAMKQTQGTTMVANDLSIKLCSDVYGVTAVNTFNLPILSTVPKVWTMLELDFGAALGASIKSVAFYVNVDRGEQTFLIDDIAVLEPLPAAFDYPGMYTNGAP